MISWLQIFIFVEIHLCLSFTFPGSAIARKQESIFQAMRIPKEENGVLSLLEKYPTADGRGIKIAILDTGCDLAASGLQKTSDGKPKYLDFIDCTGDGDVDMNKTIKLNSTKSIEGLSGRNLTLGEWAADAEEVRLGAVRLFHLLPGSVKRRLKRERKEAFVKSHDELISKKQQELDSLRTQKESDDEGTKEEIKDLELMIEKLNSIMQSYEDSGPLMDVVMYDDKGVWKTVIDIAANGDIANAIPVAPFGHSRQTGELGFGSAVTFCVQVYEGGKILSIVTDAGSHGTHVAGIAAAYFAEDGNGEEEENGNKESLSGVAPGAQILACKIGDGRLGSAETGTGLVRALIAAKKYECDLINLSYGEPAWQFDSGRVSQTFSDAVYKWGMTVFTSAGNDGPALSSLGSPGSLSAPITVGAYVSKDMMIDQYSTLPPAEEEAPLEGSPYYFTSRGPTPDGILPDLCAPGGAISPIPRHSLQGKAQYHGTSMASPNACGVAACVLSALKIEGINKCSPTVLKRGLVNSAIPVAISDPFGEGAGLISALRATEYILANYGKDGEKVPIDISIPSRNNARGIYVRDALELDGPMTFGVLVKPRFDHANERTSDEMNELLSLELDLHLKPSEPWVVCPERMTLLSATERNGQSFAIRLQTQDLPPGAHFATVDAVFPSDDERGPIFQVPIAVIVPHSKFLSDGNLSYFEINDHETIEIKDNGIDFSTTYKLLPGAPNRRFLTVPESAEWATIKVRSSANSPSYTSPHNILLHAIPFVRGDLPNTEIQIKRVVRLNEGIERTFHVRVKGGSTLELCLQLLWLANPSVASVIVDIEFHSLNIRAPTFASSQPISISAASEFARLGAGASLRSEELNPSASLSSVERTIRPQKYDISSGSLERDVLPPSDAEVKAAQSNGKILDGRQIFDMILSYEFKVEGEKAISVTPSVPSLFRQLYDSPLDSQLWVLEDSNSRVLEYGSSMHQASSVSLCKGDYIVKLHIRHPDRDFLEKMKDLPCQIKFDLPEPLTCNAYADLDKASTPAITTDDRKPLGLSVLRKGSHQDIYIARPTADLPAWVTPGDAITGSLVLDKKIKAATSMKLVYAVPPKSSKKSSDDAKPAEDEDDLEDVVFDAKVKFLKKLRTKKSDAYTKLADELKKEKPMSIPLLLELLASAKTSKMPEGEKNELELSVSTKASAPTEGEKNENQRRAQEIGKVKDAMMKANGGPIDEAILAQYFGVNVPNDDDIKNDEEAKKLKKEMNEQKKALKNVLLAMSVVYGKLAEIDESKIQEFDSSVKELKKWVSGISDLNDDDDKLSLSIVFAQYARLCQKKTASALSNLIEARKKLKEGSYKDVTMEFIRIYESMEGAEHLVENEKNNIFDRFPVVKQGI